MTSIVRPDCVGPASIVRVFDVPPECAGARVDVFVQSRLRNTSRTRARAIVERSAFTADGRRLRANDRIRGLERIVLWRPEWDKVLEAELEVLYEDEHVLVINKPALVTVHPTARHHNATVIKSLQEHRPGEFLTLLHRLDRETSGVLLVARSPAADTAFKRVIEQRNRVRKTYFAITWGVPQRGRIDLPLEQDRSSSLRVKMRIAEATAGLAAVTCIDVVETRGRYAWIRAEPTTGRQHQIRVHLAAIGCPIVGDKLYGPDDRLLARAADGELTDADRSLLELPRHALHAHRYRLTHPMTGEQLDVASPMPDDLRLFWDDLQDS